MRRRALLLAAAAANLAGASGAGGACKAPAPGRYLLTVTTAGGVSVIDDAGRVVRPPRAVLAATPGWGRMVTAAPSGPDTRVAVQDWRGERAGVTLRGRLEPRIVSPDGRLVASVTPGGAGIYGLHEAGGRDRTTVVVSRVSDVDGVAGEVARLDLPGNLEPEAFSPGGERLYLMDFLPPGKPDRYRAVAVGLRSGIVEPMETVATRAHRVVRVHDEQRGRLFAICAGEGEAYVHCLDLATAVAHRVGLPPPFGGGRPGVHSLALSGPGDRLCAVHSLSATLAEIDPDRLVVKELSAFAPAPQEGKPGLVFTRDGRLVIGLDGRIIAAAAPGQPHREMPMPGEPRGLVVGPGSGHEIWAGHPQGVVRFDSSTGAELGRVRIPGLYVLKQVSDG